MTKILVLTTLLSLPAWAEEAPAPAAPAAPTTETKAEEKKPEAKPKDEFKTDDERILYALGVVVSRNLHDFDLKGSEVKFIAMGLRDAAERAPLKIELPIYGPKISDLQRRRQTARAEADKKRAAGEKKKSEEFLKKAAKEKGAKKFPSGLIYQETTAGTGASPTAADRVKVHYEGTLINGTVFDSSYQRNEPATFPLGGVIPCWTEGVQKMKVGGKAKLVCPSDIAYGDQGSPPTIPGGATLVFQVELLEVVK